MRFLVAVNVLLAGTTRMFSSMPCVAFVLKRGSPLVSKWGFLELTASPASRNKCQTTSPFLVQTHGLRSLFASSSFSQSDDKRKDDLTKTTAYWSTDKVRSTFIDYFSSVRDHTVYPSSPCAPLNDPTLLFANAGMNQFKPIFLGRADPSSPLSSLRRAANSQKCIRAGGKHNDLEDVGRDTYHHTFFEMLGSWSFGDYFKEEAIDYAWDLLTRIYGINGERLYATYFAGDDRLGLDADLEAKELWLKYLPKERVIGCDSKDNFWEMGEIGPCGPCTEIHYDRIGNRDAASLVNADDPDVIEIWNIVFIQFNRDESGLSSLPQKHIDTGMGLERLASLLQDKSSNYDIDIFQPLFEKIAEFSKVGAYGGLVLEDDKTLRDTAYRAIADHARTLCFAIADGAVPNNEGRGYVLRRVLRRAARYGQQILKADPGFFSSLVPVVVDTFGEAYPELVKNQGTMREVIEEEESAFSSMLDRGIAYFTEMKSSLDKTGTSVVPGDKAFFLYDTLGFPVDLTEQMAEEAGLMVDVAGFQSEMEAQKQRSREARSAAKLGDAKPLELIAEQTDWLGKNGVEPTDDSLKYEWDVEPTATVKSIFTEDGFLSDDSTASDGDRIGLVLDLSSFYAEAGGQEADMGAIVVVDHDGSTAATLYVSDVQSYGGFILHSGIVKDGNIKVGSRVKCKVDYDRRRDVAPNHTMTHVLNAALRKVLGDGVEQRGSLCNDEKLRFDFSHKKAMTKGQLHETEDFVRKSIYDAEPVSSDIMPLSEACAIDGIRSVFGELYPDPVRVVSVGSDTSIEFCGGTHLANAADAEAFALVEETAVAKGIRRITGLTGSAAKVAIEEGEMFQSLMAATEKEASNGQMQDLDKRAGSLRKDLEGRIMSAPLKAELRARIEILQKKGAEARKAELANRVDRCIKVVKEQVEQTKKNGNEMIVLNVDIGADSKASQKIMNTVKKIAPDIAFMGLSEEEKGSGGKLMCFAAISDTLVEEGMRADEWVRAALSVCEGRGGGKPNSAQGQAKECNDIGAVKSAATTYAESFLGSKII